MRAYMYMIILLDNQLYLCLYKAIEKINIGLDLVLIWRY